MKSESAPDAEKKDEAAAEPPSDEAPASEHADSEEGGGPYGDPESNEETLRKHQEEASGRSERDD